MRVNIPRNDDLKAQFISDEFYKHNSRVKKRRTYEIPHEIYIYPLSSNTPINY